MITFLTAFILYKGNADAMWQLSFLILCVVRFIIYCPDQILSIKFLLSSVTVVMCFYLVVSNVPPEKDLPYYIGLPMLISLLGIPLSIIAFIWSTPL